MDCFEPFREVYHVVPYFPRCINGHSLAIFCVNLYKRLRKALQRCIHFLKIFVFSIFKVTMLLYKIETLKKHTLYKMKVPHGPPHPDLYP